MTRVLIFAGFLIAAIYMLSIGPAVWLHSRGYIGVSSVETIYQPLVVVANSWEPLDDSLGWYVDLFVPPRPALPPPPPESTRLPYVSPSAGTATPMPMPPGLRPAAP